MAVGRGPNGAIVGIGVDPTAGRNDSRERPATYLGSIESSQTRLVNVSLVAPS